MIRRPPRSTLDRSSAASDVYKRQVIPSLEPADLALVVHGLVHAVGHLADQGEGLPHLLDGSVLVVQHALDVAAPLRDAAWVPALTRLERPGLSLPVLRPPVFRTISHANPP